MKYEFLPELKQKLRNLGAENDQDLGRVGRKDNLQQRNHSRYIVEENILYKLMDGRWKIVTLEHLIDEILWFCHTSLPHAGAYRCYLVLREDFIWNSITKKVRVTLRGCHDCQTSKYHNQHTYVEMNNIITKGKIEILCIDFLRPLPKATRGLKHLIVCVDGSM